MSAAEDMARVLDNAIYQLGLIVDRSIAGVSPDVDRQRFLDEAAVRMLASHVYIEDNDSVTRLSVEQAYEIAEELWSERERRRAALMESEASSG